MREKSNYNNNRVFKGILLLLFFNHLLHFAFHVNAQDPADSVLMDTDRPGVSFAASTVERRYLLVEYGLSFLQESAQANLNSQEVEFANVLLRYGLLEKLEVRLQQSYRSQLLSSDDQIDANGWQFGLLPTSVGLKYDLEDLLSLDGQSVLVFDYRFSKQNGYYVAANPTLQFTYVSTTKLSDFWALTYNLGYDINVNQRNSFRYTLKAGAVLSEALSGFLEFYGSKAHSSTALNNINAGLVYLVNNQFQLDVSAGMDIVRLYNEVLAYRQSFISVGASFILPFMK